MRMIDDDKNLDSWKSRSASKGKQNWAEGWKAPIRQSRDFLGILTFSKICETGGTWMVCLPPWMRWGLARPVGGILIITTALVTHIKTLFHLKIFELLFFLWETSKGYTGWHFKKTNLGCCALPVALMSTLLEQFVIFAQPNVYDIFLHILQIFTHHNNQAASHSWDQGTDSNKPCWGNMNSEIVPQFLSILLCQKS